MLRVIEAIRKLRGSQKNWSGLTSEEVASSSDANRIKFWGARASSLGAPRRVKREREPLAELGLALFLVKMSILVLLMRDVHLDTSSYKDNHLAKLVISFLVE